MKVLLLAGYRELDPYRERGLGLDPQGEFDTLLDFQIDWLSSAGFEIACIVAGPAAEDQLRLSRRLADVELVFDDHPAPPNLLTNIRAGLGDEPREAHLILPVELEPLPARFWRTLLYEHVRLGFATPHHILRLVGSEGAPWHHGFPLLLTRKGAQLVAETPDLNSLLDPRVVHGAVNHDSRLAWPANAL